MNILVLSDSHSYMDFMERCVEDVRPDAIVHLGDYYRDGEALRRRYPDIPFYQVPGNCDEYSYMDYGPATVVEKIGGVKLYMTHGHRHRVKSSTSSLLQDARSAGADAVLYGHTHIPDCHREEDGLWVLNPGTSGYFGSTAGLIETEGGRIKQCRILGRDNHF